MMPNTENEESMDKAALLQLYYSSLIIEAWFVKQEIKLERVKTAFCSKNFEPR